MTISTREITRDEEKHIITTEEILDLPPDWLSRQFIQRRQMKSITYWCQDDQGYFYVIRKALPMHDKRYLSDVQEAFVCVPLESGKSLVYFFSEFNYGRQGPSIIVNSGFQD